MTNEKGDFFVKTDVMKNIVTLGCNHTHTPRAHHTIEVNYAMNDKTEKLLG